jgi:hypothetical protein
MLIAAPKSQGAPHSDLLYNGMEKRVGFSWVLPLLLAIAGTLITLALLR